MSNVIWTGGALALAAAILWAAAQVLMRPTPLPPGSEPMPSTDLQRASRWSLVLALIPALAAVLLVAVVGPERTLADDVPRVTLSLLAVASLAAAGGGAWWVVRRGGQGTGNLTVDERDRAILERAPVVQSAATVLALAAWTVILTERFADSGGVPLAFIQLVFWSCLMVNLLGLPAGVLIGYRKS